MKTHLVIPTSTTWGRQEFREIQRKICRGAAGAEIFRNLPPDKLGTVHMAPGLAPGHYRWTQTVPDLNCLAIFGPSPPQPRRAARRARSSGPTLVPSPAAPAPRSLSVLRHAGSAELCTRGEIHEICHSGSEEEKRNVIEICHTRFEIMASKFPMAAFRNSGLPQSTTRRMQMPLHPAMVRPYKSVRW